MKRRVIAPRSIFKAEEWGFSQGIRIEGGKDILFISGQLAAVKKGKFTGGSFREQCKGALDGIGAVLKDAGATKKNVVKITGYVTDMDGSIEEFVRQTKEYFSGGYPASTLVQVSRLAFPGQLVEIEAIAVW